MSNNSLLNISKNLNSISKNNSFKKTNSPPSYNNAMKTKTTKPKSSKGFDIRKSANDAANKVKTTVKKYPIQVAIAIVVIFSAIAIYYGYLLVKDYNTTSSSEPWILQGNKSADTQMTIPASIIKPSIDAQHGIEFTYSFWMYIKNWNVKDNEWKHVFHKGNSTAIPLQSPGVWLYPKTNKLAINMNTFESVKETCEIGNLPLHKWMNITISVMGKNVDVYVNSRLKKRCKLKGVPKLNLGNLYINNWGGFDGYMSRIKYFNYAIPYWKVEKLVERGPADSACIDTGESPPYLSNRWWMTTGYPEARGFLNN